MAKPTNFGRKGSMYGFLNEMSDSGYRPQNGQNTRKTTDQRVLRNPRYPRVADESTLARLTNNIRHKVW